jgi:hypothetical protein
MLHYGLQCGLRLAHNNVTGGHWNMAMKARADRPGACGRFIGKASQPLPRLDGALVGLSGGRNFTIRRNAVAGTGISRWQSLAPDTCSFLFLEGET